MKKFSIAIPYALNECLKNHLIREDGQEDLCFGLWYPSEGATRFTALLHSIVLPEEGDRQVHGNVSFNACYFKRVCALAMKAGCGIALLHSHPGDGWQGMSQDDIDAETKLSSSAETLTDLSFLGLTISQDAVWSGRIWNYSEVEGKYKRQWASNVRVVGEALEVYYDDTQQPEVRFKEHFKRTINVWGKENHQKLARLRIGIVGVGSVGSLVAEALSRMGLQNITMIDFDLVETHNLDRLCGVTEADIGREKVLAIKESIERSATADNIRFHAVPFSIAEEQGYRAALDADVLFSCVDKPRARYILNHIAYNHLIPVIDGGIQVRFNEDEEFIGAEWQLQTIGPGKPCLRCLGSYKDYDVALEENGLLEDPAYIKGLKKGHDLKNNENIFPFSMNLASLEVFHLVALVTGIGNVLNYGVQRFRYNNGFISNYEDKRCTDQCTFQRTVAEGDRELQVFTTILRVPSEGLKPQAGQNDYNYT